MNHAVYTFLLKTYGQLPQYWLGLGSIILQTLLLRVVTVLIIARLASAVATGDFEGAKGWILLYVGVAVAGLLFRLIKETVTIKAENKQYARMILTYYQKLVSKDMSFFHDHQTGYLASTFRQHMDSGLDLARMFRGEIVQTAISLIVPTIVLLIASRPVGLAALAVVIAQVFYVMWASKAANKYRLRSHEAYRQISGTVSDDVTNIVAYKTSGVTEGAHQRLKQLAEEEAETFWLRRKVIAILDTPRDILTILGTAAAFWVVVINVQSASDSVALVVLTVTYMFQISQNVTNLPDVMTRHDDLITKMYPTLEYLTDKHEAITDPPKPKPLPAIRHGEVEFRDVTFSYGPQDKPVFRDLNLHIPPGQQVGVVGLSGAGKSTLASLLLRFDDVRAGTIYVDGIAIRELRQADLRQEIAYVPQEPLLFHRTIRENLQYLADDLSEKRMLRAAKAAHAHEFISQLPHGYDTLVGERGVKLSGGQKQRIVIARAILKNASIMLFDEATSALDSESEKIIQAALPEIIGKRTAIVIAHRLSTVAGLDRIIVMHAGKIVEDGTHAQLLAQKGRYFALWQKQTTEI